MLRWWLLPTLLGSAVASAGQVERIDVSNQDGVYRVTLVAEISAPPRRFIELLTDYSRLNAINPSVRESRVLVSISPLQQRVQTRIELCVLWFCSEFHQVQDMQLQPPDRLAARVLPQYSDFRSGWAQWRFIGAEQGTRLYFESELEPDFYIPPLIGPAIVRHMMRREALATIAGLERLAR